MIAKHTAALTVLFLTFNVSSSLGQINLTSFEKVARPDSMRKSVEDKWTSQDKFSHLTVSAFLVGGQFFALKEFAELQTAEARNAAVISTAVIGVAKEIYDHVSKKGQPSLKDIGADFLGVGLAVLMLHNY